MERFIPVVRSSLSMFTILPKMEAEDATSQRPSPASGLSFSLAAALAPGLFGTALVWGLSDTATPHQYRHWEQDRSVQYFQDHIGLTACPVPSLGPKDSSSRTPPHHQQPPSHFPQLACPSSSALPGHRLGVQTRHHMLAEGTSFAAPSPSHPLQTFVVMVTAPEGKSS